MSLKVVRLDTAEAVADTAAAIIARQIIEKPHTVLGLATGRTPLPIYHRLTRMYEAGQLSFRDVTRFNLDEYVGLPASHPASFATYMQQTVFDRIDARGHHINLLDGTASCLHEEAASYEAQGEIEEDEMDCIIVSHRVDIGDRVLVIGGHHLVYRQLLHRQLAKPVPYYNTETEAGIIANHYIVG